MARAASRELLCLQVGAGVLMAAILMVRGRSAREQKGERARARIVCAVIQR